MHNGQTTKFALASRTRPAAFELPDSMSNTAPLLAGAYVTCVTQRLTVGCYVTEGADPNGAQGTYTSVPATQAPGCYVTLESRP